jgi:hypothetical protein
MAIFAASMIKRRGPGEYQRYLFLETFPAIVKGRPGSEGVGWSPMIELADRRRNAAGQLEAFAALVVMSLQDRSVCKTDEEQ